MTGRMAGILITCFLVRRFQTPDLGRPITVAVDARVNSRKSLAENPCGAAVSSTSSE